MPVRVILADDHLILRQALKALLEREGLRVVADVADGRAAVDAVCRFGPDVVVLDVAMPLLNGVDAAWEISRAAPHTHVLLLSGLDDPRFVPDALRAGVRGFVLKSQGAEDLLRAIEEVQGGGLYVSPGASQSVLEAFKATGQPPGKRLSVRERQVVQLVAEGKSTKQIAQVLHISVKTAEFHRGRVMKKLDVHETAGLVRYAIREGLIVP
jgi:DNA-binding NarL/FixJ family response regulator